MYLAQLPFFPANRAVYDYATLPATGEAVAALYPELFRCVACNSCTKICPMDVEVLDYVSAIKRGDLELAMKLSFDCIQCGLCASRCMGELPQYHIAQLVRRLYGGKLAPKTPHIEEMVSKIATSYFEGKIAELKKMPLDQLKKLYTERVQEPHQGPEFWTPPSDVGL